MIYQNNKKKRTKGYTLIEMLIIISIIALLTIFAVVMINNERLKSRNVKRMNDAGHLTKAIEMYYLHYEAWPLKTALEYCCLGYDTTETCFDSGGPGFTGCGDDINQQLIPYINPIPKSPNFVGHYAGTKTGYYWPDDDLYLDSFFVVFEKSGFRDFNESCAGYVDLPAEDATVCAIDVARLFGE